MIALASLGILGLGGFLAFVYAPWASIMPTGWLAKLQSWNNEKAGHELYSRLMGGTIPKNEMADALDDMISFHLVPMPLYSKDVEVGIGLQPRIRMKELFPKHWIYFRDIEVFVDGQQREDMRTAAAAKFDGNVRFALKPLTPGRHEIALKCRAVLAPANLKVADSEARSIYERRVETSQNVDIDTRTAAEIYSPAKGRQIREATKNVVIGYFAKTIRNSAGNSVTQYDLFIQNRMGRTESLSGTLYVRPKGKGEYKLVTQLVQRDMEEDWLSLDHIPEIAGAKAIDVKLTPDPAPLVLMGRKATTHYVAETIERKGVYRGFN